MAVKKQAPKNGLAALVRAFARDPRVEVPSDSGGGFGSAALKVDGKIFAMEVSGRVVLKLPRARVEALIAEGRGGPFATGGDRVMKEWVSLSVGGAECVDLAREALTFVGGATKRRR